MIGHSEKMKEAHRFIDKAGPSDRTVLIHGASGTGKEQVAHAIHRNSPRSGKPFLAVNCAALTDTLLESELFGHEKGTFTGAVSQRKGLFELADGGTIFLDEIGELPMAMQPALLRVLQDGEFKRLGGSRSMHVNVRVIAATNRNLEQAIREGRFRQDLFFRLNVLEIEMPSLCERSEDIPLLAAYFIKKYGYIRTDSGMAPVLGITPEAHHLLATYAWPGNIRELEHATFSAADQEAILAAVGAIRQKLPFLVDLSPDERKAILKLGGKTHGFAKKAFEIAAQNPGILPASVSVDELRNTEHLYEGLSAIKLAIDQLQKQDDTTMQVGSDAYATARSIYACAKNGFVGASLKTAADELGKRFGRKNRPATSDLTDVVG
jgi:transcriptional regulator with GAF, ATPase, and Fis domain